MEMYDNEYDDGDDGGVYAGASYGAKNGSTFTKPRVTAAFGMSANGIAKKSHNFK